MNKRDLPYATRLLAGRIISEQCQTHLTGIMVAVVHGGASGVYIKTDKAEAWRCAQNRTPRFVFLIALRALTKLDAMTSELGKPHPSRQLIYPIFLSVCR